MPFLAMLGPWALKHWAAIAVSVALAAVALYVVTLQGRLNHVKAALTTERAAHARDVATCAANTKRLTDAIAVKNAATMAVADQGRSDTARAAADMAQARKASAGVSNRVRVILATPPGPDACASADAVILGSIKP